MQLITYFVRHKRISELLNWVIVLQAAAVANTFGLTTSIGASEETNVRAILTDEYVVPIFQAATAKAAENGPIIVRRTHPRMLRAAPVTEFRGKRIVTQLDSAAAPFLRPENRFLTLLTSAPEEYQAHALPSQQGRGRTQRFNPFRTAVAFLGTHYIIRI